MCYFVIKCVIWTKLVLFIRIIEKLLNEHKLLNIQEKNNKKILQNWIGSDKKKQWMLFNGAVWRKHRENEVHEKSMIYKLKLWVAQCT